MFIPFISKPVQYLWYTIDHTLVVSGKQLTNFWRIMQPVANRCIDRVSAFRWTLLARCSNLKSCGGSQTVTWDILYKQNRSLQRVRMKTYIFCISQFLRMWNKEITESDRFLVLIVYSSRSISIPDFLTSGLNTRDCRLISGIFRPNKWYNSYQSRSRRIY